MMTRTAASLLALACVLSPALADDPPPPSSGKAADGLKRTHTISYRVEYKKAGNPAWLTRSTYTDESAAMAELNRLVAAGHDVRITRVEAVTVERTESPVSDDAPPAPKKAEPTKKVIPPVKTDMVVRAGASWKEVGVG